MNIGYYTLDISFFDHTYAQMVQEKDIHVNFQCSGGINGKNNVNPAVFYDPISHVSTGYNSYTCNMAVARILASWEPEIDWNRTNYNRSNKWQANASDNAGLAYAITGVWELMVVEHIEWK